MKTIVLDTDILIDSVNGFAPWLVRSRNKKGFRFVIPTIVVAEYFTSQEIETKLGRKKSDEFMALFTKEDLTEEIAYELGKILRRKTYTSSASTADLIIAATAIYLDAELATRNKKDFAKIPDLRFFDPEKLKLKS